MKPDRAKAATATTSASCTAHPLVSVVMATRGLSPRFSRCLAALEAQECVNYEVLVVLNGPDDPAFHEALASHGARIIHEPRPGVSVARNAAARAARGEILAITDDDVTMGPGWLHELLCGFDDPAVACVTGRLVPRGPGYLPEEKYASERALSEWTLSPGDGGWYPEALRTDMGFGCNMAFRRRFVLEQCPFPEDLGAGSLIGAADEPFMFVRVLQRGFKVHHNPRATVTHYFMPDDPLRKVRVRQLYLAATAFRAKMLFEEPALRPLVLREFLAGFGKFLDMRRRPARTQGAPDVLSWREKGQALLLGPWLYWKSVRRRKARQRHA